MPELYVDFEVYCGICGDGVCSDTSTRGLTVTVKCSHCESRIKELEGRVEELELLDETCRAYEQHISELEEELAEGRNNE